MSTPTSFRLSNETARQLAALAPLYNGNVTTVVTVAVDRMYKEEIGEMSNEVVIHNWQRSRSFGWEYSTTPTGHGSEIALPAKPFYTGTYRQITEKRGADSAFNNLGGTYHTEAWFYKGRRITHVDGMEVSRYGFDPDPNDDDITVALADSA